MTDHQPSQRVSYPYAPECNEAASVLEQLARGETLVPSHRPSELRSIAHTAAALRELARLVEEAERVAKLSDQYGPSMVAWRDLIRSISTGFDPAEAGGGEQQ